MKLCFPWNTFIYVLNFLVRIGCCFTEQPCSENDAPLFQINTTELISYMYMIVKLFSNCGCYLVVLNTYVLSYLVMYLCPHKLNNRFLKIKLHIPNHKIELKLTVLNQILHVSSNLLIFDMIFEQVLLYLIISKRRLTF